MILRMSLCLLAHTYCTYQVRVMLGKLNWEFENLSVVQQ